jgi:large subunit ribosomal protein L3
MISGIWGKKIGMTQVFHKDQAIPVTVVDVGNWIVTGFKTEKRDGYNAIQVGCVKKRYANETPQSSWIKEPKTYFTHIREIPSTQLPEGLKIGSSVDFFNQWQQGEQVDVFGLTRGRGFAGAVKRHRFRGGPASHGGTLGRATGGISHMRACGRVIKGKRMPGHMGVARRTMRNLNVVEVRQDGPIVLIKGSVPGHSGSLLYLRRLPQNV